MGKSRVSSAKQARLMEYSASGTTARTAAALAEINKNTAAYFFQRLGMIMAQALKEELPLAGKIQLDEKYFCVRRKGNRGWGAAGKVPVFGILKRGEGVYTKMIPDTKVKTLLGIMQDRIVPDCTVFTDTYQSNNGMFQNSNTIASNIRRGLWRSTNTSMDSKISGTMRGIPYASSMVCHDNFSTFSWKNVNGGLIPRPRNIN